MKLEYLLSLPRSLLFNLRYLSRPDCFKVPILIARGVYIKELKGRLEIRSQEEIRMGMIKIGFGEVGIYDKRKRRTIINLSKGAALIFEGSCSVGHGSALSIQKEGILNLGDGFCMTAESKVVCSKAITFGQGCLVSWDCLIMDTDFHKIYNNKTGGQINKDEAVVIGDRVWIGCRSVLLKGTQIPNDSVIAAASLMTKSFIREGCILGGNPGEILKEAIWWEN
jgi:acetyltransferase-like isoleucine patch superfamily enzyme